MVTLDWECERLDGITLVEVLAESDSAERIRLASTLEPTWPPRRQGVPAAGWDDGAVEGVVGPDDRLLVGFASPAEPVEPPVEVIEETPISDSEVQEATVDSELDPETVDAPSLVRVLGDATPPRDVVPAPESPVTPEGGMEHGAQETDTQRCTEPAPSRDDGGDGTDDAAPSEPTVEQAPPGADSVSLELWYAAIEDRLDRADAFASVSNPTDAKEVIDAAGGIEGVRQLQAQLAADRRQLERLESRAATLRNRIEKMEVPVSTLERLA